MVEIVAARLGIGWGWDDGEDGWKPGVDQNFRQLDATIGLNIISDALSTPPGSPADGDTYLVKATGTGAWAAHDDEIAAFQAGTWYFYPVVNGLRAYFVNHSEFRFLLGGTWVAEPSSTVANLDDLGDVNLGTITVGQVLQYNGTDWVNETLTFALDDLSDVNVGTATTGDVLKFDGTNWVSGTASAVGKLDDLSDVTITTATLGDIVAYDGTTWVNVQLPALPLDGLSDVVITSPGTSDILQYNGTNWVNGTITASGTIAANSLAGNSGTVGAVPSTIAISTDFVLTGGTLDLAPNITLGGTVGSIQVGTVSGNLNGIRATGNNAVSTWNTADLQVYAGQSIGFQGNPSGAGAAGLMTVRIDPRSGAINTISTITTSGLISRIGGIQLNEQPSGGATIDVVGRYPSYLGGVGTSATIANGALASGGSGCVAGERFFDPLTGSVFTTTAVGTGDVTALTLTLPGWWYTVSTPSNPVALTSINGVGAGVSVNLTWALPAGINLNPTGGIVTVPTPVVDSNNTRAASTAYVIGQAATVAPLPPATAAVGTSLRYARQDHVHNYATLAATKLFGNATTAAAVPGAISIGGGLQLPATGTLDLATIAANTIHANTGTAAAVPTGVTIGNGLFVNSGTISAQNVGTVAATTTAVVTPTGMDAVLINVGTVDTTINVNPGFAYQRLRVHINQGATAHVPTLGTTVAFSTDITAYTPGTLASKSDHVMLIANSTGSIWNVEAINRGLTL